MEPGGEAPPPHIPDFELVRRIGSGGFGEVWLAKSVTGAWRAVKLVHRRGEDDSAFTREFEGIRQFTRFSLGQPGQLALLHVGRNDKVGLLYYVMELADDAILGTEIIPETYLPGTLRELQQRRGALPVTEVVQLGLALARSLASLHRAGLVHRDIKPSNVILVGGVPKLADIGLVTVEGEGKTFVGTPGYVPPEGPGMPTADLFGLGRLLYEMATGFPAREFPRPPAPSPDRESRMLFGALNAILVRACAPQLKDRYRTAEELIEDLVLVQAQKSMRRLTQFTRTLKRVSFAVGGLAIGAGVLAGFFIHQARRFSEEAYGAEINQAAQALERNNLPVASKLLVTRKSRWFDVRGFEWFALRHDADGNPTRWRQHVELPAVSLHFDLKHGVLLGAGKPEKGLSLVTAWRLTDGEPVWSHYASSGLLAVNPEAALRKVDPAQTPQPVPSLERRAPLLQSDTGRWSERSVVPTNTIQIWQVAQESSGPWERQTVPLPLWQPGDTPFLTQALQTPGLQVAVALMNGRNQNARCRIVSFSQPHPEHAWSFPVQSLVMALCLSPDGRQLAVATTGDAENLLLLSTESGQLLWSTGRHSGTARVLGFSPDGKQVASGGDDAVIYLTDSASGKLNERLVGLQGSVSALQWHPDGQQLAAASFNGEVLIWSLPEATRRRQVSGLHRGDGGGLAFSADGQRLAVSGEGNSTRVFNPDDLRNPIEIPGIFCPLDFWPDGRVLGYDRQGRAVWQVAGVQPATQIGSKLLVGIAGNPEISTAVGRTVGPGAWIFVAGTDGTERFWQLPGANPLWETHVPAKPTGGSNPAFTSYARPADRILSAHRDGQIRILRPDSPQPVSEWSIPPNIVGAYLEPQAQWCVISDSKLQLHRYRVRDGKKLQTSSMSAEIYCLTTDQATQRLIGGTTTGDLEVFPLNALNRITSLPAVDTRTLSGETIVRSIAFSPQGHWLAARTSAGTLKVWYTRRDTGR